MDEGISRCIKATVIDGSLSNLTIHGVNLPTTHIQFVDDTMLMGALTVREERNFN